MTDNQKKYKQIYKSKNKRYLFAPTNTTITGKKKRRKFNDDINHKKLEVLFMKDIDMLSDKIGLNGGNGNRHKKKTKKELDDKVMELYVHFLFTRDIRYIEKLTEYAIPPILAKLKGYKRYFPNGDDFQDLILYVISSIAEEFKSLKWAVGKGGFMTFIFPRVQKFIQEYLKEYQRENEEMARTSINEEQNYAIVSEKKTNGSDNDIEINERILSIKVTGLDTNEIFKAQLKDILDNIKVVINQDKIDEIIINDKEFLFNIRYFSELFKNIINENNILFKLKNKKNKINEIDIKRTFLFLIRNELFELKNKEELGKNMEDIIIGVKKDKFLF